MTTVYVLTVLLASSSFLGPTKIDVETYVFEDAGRCLRNIESNRARLESEYSEVKMFCTPREIVKGKR